MGYIAHSEGDNTTMETVTTSNDTNTTTTLSPEQIASVIQQRKALMEQLAQLELPKEAQNAAVINARQKWIDTTAEFTEVAKSFNDKLQGIANEIKSLGGRVPRRDENGSYHADPTKDRPTQGDETTAQTQEGVSQNASKRGRKPGKAQAAASATQ